MALGFPGVFQSGLTTGYLIPGAVQKQVTSVGFTGVFQGGLTTGYLTIGAVQKNTSGAAAASLLFNPMSAMQVLLTR